MNEIKWEDPPADARRNDWAPIAAELRAHPMKWAMIAARKTIGPASDISEKVKGARPTSPKFFQPPGSFEAVTRKVDGEYRVYARYVGGES